MSHKQLMIFFTNPNRINLDCLLAGRSGLLLSSRYNALSRWLPR